MLSNDQLKTISNFLLDGSKILFGSLVVGAFMPSTSGSISWVTITVGFISTVVFLSIAVRLSKITI